MPDRSLDSLSSDFRPLAAEWILRCTARGIAVLIVQTSRTEAEHRANLANGTSGTSLSLHLPRRLRTSTMVGFTTKPEDDDKCDAMDVAPYSEYILHGAKKLLWNSKHPAFKVIAEEAESLKLRSGIRWSKPFDPGHAELALPIKRLLIADELTRALPEFRA